MDGAVAEPRVKVLRYHHLERRADVAFRTTVQSSKGTYYIDMSVLPPNLNDCDYVEHVHIIASCKNGLVIRGVNAVTGEPKAIKILSTTLIAQSEGARERLAAEMHINQALQSQYSDENAFAAGATFVTCFDTMIQDQQLGAVLIVMPLVSGGDMFTFIESQVVDPQLLATWLHQLCFALGYCHERRVAHRDIDPQNIMLTQDMDLRLIDFDQAAPVPGDGLIPASWAGKEPYVSYQVKQKAQLAARARSVGEEVPSLLAKPQDVWSLAATIYALIFRRHPYQQALQSDPEFLRLCNGDWPPWPEQIPGGVRDVLLTVFQNWEHDALRPTVAKFLSDMLRAVSGPAAGAGAGGV